MARDDDCRSHTLVAVTRTVVFLSLVGIVLLAPVWATSGAGLVPNGEDYENEEIESVSLSREKTTLLQSVRAEVLDLASKLNAALATLTDVLRSKSSKHRDASGGTTLQLAQDLLSGLEDGDETSDSSKAVAQRADATMTSPTRTEKYWPGNDPLYGDPGISSIPGKVAREFRKELPHSFAWLSPDELRDARKARFMAREALAGSGVQFSRDRLGVHPPTDAKTFIRQEAVRKAFKHAWKGYVEFAWGHDQLRPISQRGSRGVCDMALTIVDSLDAMIIMDLPEAYFAAREFVRNELRFDKQDDINVFETNIRVVGGLLGAYELSRDKLFLDKARELVDRLMIAFDTPTGVPLGTINMKHRYAHNSDVPGSSISEVATLQLEFQYLSYHTGNLTYASAVDKVMRVLERNNPMDGLYPMFIDPNSGLLLQSTVTLGARGDSLYEYLLKQFLLAGNRRHEKMWLLDMYSKSVKGILSKLLQYSTPSGYAYVAEQTKAASPYDDMSPTLRHKVDHLTCFVPGMLALGAVNAAGLDFAETGNVFMRKRLSGELHTQVMAALEKEASVAQHRLTGSETPVPQPQPREAACTDDGCEVNIGSGSDTQTSSGDQQQQHQRQQQPHAPPAPMRQPPNLFSVVKDTDTAVAAATKSVIDTFLQPLEIRGVVELVKDEMNRILEIAANLTHTCYQMYAQTKSGLAPEIVTFKPRRDFKPNSDAAHSLLRPETVESLFVMFRLTRDTKYQDWGWEIFKAIERNARVESGGYSGLKDVNAANPEATANKDDHMDSFFMAETLKYLYLLYAEPSLIPLDEYVLNTEAHPFRIFNYTEPRDVH